MIRRSVQVCAVTTRWWFGPKTVSFYVSVCFYIIFLCTVISRRLYVTVSFHVNDWYILPIWLSVPLHDVSVSVHLIFVVDMSVYQCNTPLPEYVLSCVFRFFDRIFRFTSYIFPLFTVASRCSCIYSYHFMWTIDIFYQYDYLYHFMRYQWAFILIM